MIGILIPTIAGVAWLVERLTPGDGSQSRTPVGGHSVKGQRPAEATSERDYAGQNLDVPLLPRPRRMPLLEECPPDGPKRVPLCHTHPCRGGRTARHATLPQMQRVAYWDFDGTLAFRPGGWLGAAMQALDQLHPAHEISAEAMRPLLRAGYPWHTPGVPHAELCDPSAWWSRTESVLAQAFLRAGAPTPLTAELARRTHELYVDHASFRLYDDARMALDRLREAGYANSILSNHVPELPQIVSGLGLSDLVEHVLSSALIGYEKPHAGAYAIARSRAGGAMHPWMIGDDPDADVRGAERAGFCAVLVRSDSAAVRRHAPDLRAAAELILSEDV